MRPTIDDGLRALREATELAKTIDVELTDDYLGRIAEVEALPQNRPYADKSWVSRLIESSANFYRSARRVR